MSGRVHQYIRASHLPTLERLIAARERTGTDVLSAALDVAERYPEAHAEALRALGPGQKLPRTGRRYQKKNDAP